MPLSERKRPTTSLSECRASVLFRDTGRMEKSSNVPSARLVRKIRGDFPQGRADEVILRLGALPETSQSVERIQAAMIMRSRGDFERFMSEVELVQTDWRDTLMGSGLEHADYEQQLDHLLGPER